MRLTRQKPLKWSGFSLILALFKDREKSQLTMSA